LAGHLADRLSELFPRSVGAAFVRISGVVFPLFPEEATTVRRAVAKRRIEYAAGRHCARLAMAELGQKPCAIPSGPDRGPIWPRGLVGSITHGSDECTAVVGFEECFRSIGIDMQMVGSVPQALASKILRWDEAVALDRTSRPDDADWPTLHFCLKEAAYKAFHPLYRKVIGFHDMRIAVKTEARHFLATVPSLAAPEFTVFEGHYLVQNGCIYAGCWPVVARGA
jgi:4'-phosphopantetheinyl transferase EntD